MSHLPVQPLQAALLFENTRQFDENFPDWQELCDAISRHLGDTSAPFHILPGATGAQMATLSNDDLHITLERMDAPLSVDGFRPVLARPFYAKMHPDLVAGVENHQRAVLINVGLGNIPFPMDHELVDSLDMLTSLVGEQTQARFERRLLVAQATAVALADAFMPAVVHWGQSDQLFAGPSFVELAGAGFNLPLYVHPGFASSGRKIDDSYCTGVDAYGTKHLIAKHVVFAEHPQNMMQSYQLVLAFVAYCRSLGRLLEDGETFGAEDGGPTVEVHHMPATDAHPDGYIELRQREASDTPLPARPVRVRPSATKLRRAMRGQRNALDGKDAPDRQAQASQAVGMAAAILRTTVGKVLVALVVYLALSVSAAQVAGKFFPDLALAQTQTPETQVENTPPAPGLRPAAPMRRTLNNTPRSAPQLYQPTLPRD